MGYLEAKPGENQNPSYFEELAKELSKGDYTNLQMENMMFSKMCFKLTENDYCMVCKKNFKSMSTDLKLRRYPNGVICCYECGKEDSVCPVTGTVFKTKLDS